MTGGRDARNGQPLASPSWLAQSMRCVLRTPLGTPVEPDVKRSFATVSGPTAAKASAARPRA